MYNEFPLYYNTKDMHQLPLFIPTVFIISIGPGFNNYYSRPSEQAKNSYYILCGWLLIQAILAYFGFYHIQGDKMPRFLLLILPPTDFCHPDYDYRYRPKADRSAGSEMAYHAPYHPDSS